MQLDVYDTYARTADGRRLHFDVLVLNDTHDRAQTFAEDWLKSIGIAGAEVTLERCRFCHTESASPEVARQVARDGYLILQMEGCPNPFT